MQAATTSTQPPSSPETLRPSPSAASVGVVAWPVGPEPAPELLQRLREGYVLTPSQLERLIYEHSTAARLEAEDSRFARAAKACYRRALLHKFVPPPAARFADLK